MCCCCAGVQSGGSVNLVACNGTSASYVVRMKKSIIDPSSIYLFFLFLAVLYYHFATRSMISRPTRSSFSSFDYKYRVKDIIYFGCWHLLLFHFCVIIWYYIEDYNWDMLYYCYYYRIYLNRGIFPGIIKSRLLYEEELSYIYYNSAILLSREFAKDVII
jgi:hypothetical protein